MGAGMRAIRGIWWIDCFTDPRQRARLKPCRLARQQSCVPSDAAGVCDRAWLHRYWLALLVFLKK